MKPLILQIILVVITTCVQATTKCITPDGLIGRCVNLAACNSLMQLSMKPVQYHTVRDNLLLTYSNCFDAEQRYTRNKVCCPDKPSKLAAVNPVMCNTYDGKVGLCMNVQSCAALNDKLEQPMTARGIEIFYNSRCNYLETHSVCCSKTLFNAYPSVNYNSFEEQKYAPYTECTPSITPPEAQTYCCGDQGTHDRIVGGTETAIDDYPWLALIEYSKKETNKIEIGCGGSLISGRYVLTAAHCLSGNNIAGYIPVNVRLGEYNLWNNGPDCVAADGGGEDCTDGPLVIPIERYFVHEQYNPNSVNQHDDIALIRLSTMAPYTDFIRPICLPTSDLSINVLEGKRLFASGWGMTEVWKSISSTKREVDLPFMELDECQEYYDVINLTLTSNQMCAGGELGKDACKGDSGGPLMYENGELYEVTAIVSFGPANCGQEIPSVYINVFKYLPWIWGHINNTENTIPYYR